MDSSAYAVFAFGMLPPDEPRVVNTMNAIKNTLWVNTSIGGVARYENDYYHRVSNTLPGNPWFICTMWLAQWYIARAKNAEELQPALELLQWAARHALPSGVMPEQLNPYTGDPLSVSPLTWSHSSFVVSVVKYLEKLGEHAACTLCGAPLHRPAQQRLW